jgi:hypothetical protein
MAQSPDEKTYVEIPFIEQLKGMGWDHIEGDIDVPYLTERESFRFRNRNSFLAIPYHINIRNPGPLRRSLCRPNHRPGVSNHSRP